MSSVPECATATNTQSFIVAENRRSRKMATFSGLFIPLSAAATVSAEPKQEEKKKKEETIAANGTVIKLGQSEIIRIVNFCGEPRTKTEIMEYVGARSENDTETLGRCGISADDGASQKLKTKVHRLQS